MTKTVVITGATSGIGHATAELFASRGYKVIALGRNLAKAPVSEEILPLHVDLMLPESIEEACEKIKASCKSLAGIIHNAGIVIRKPFDDLTLDDFLKEFQIHVFSTVQMNKALHTHLTNASIVYVNSTLGIKPIPQTSAYSAAKAAQASLIQSLALEWAKHNIRVNGICLGIIDTPIQKFTAESRAEADKLQPLKRVGTSQEVAKEILNLFESEWSTGSLRIFDGGISLV